MSISVEAANDVTKIIISGRFDFQVHRDFKAAYSEVLDNAAVRQIKIELSKVDYLDSSALGMMMLLRERALAVGKVVVLSKPSQVVSQILDIANFSKLFTVL